MNAKKLLPNIYTCFPGGKHKVLTMSFDDGRPEDRRLVSVFNEYGIKGTFNVNSGLDMDNRIPLSEYPSLYAGHEIACHTHTHPTIARSPMEQIVKQVLLDREILEDVMGYPVRGLALPNGSDSPEIESVLPSLGIRYARSVKSTGGFGMPDTFLPWDATCHYNHGLMELGQQFADLYKTQYLYMMYVWGHSYEFTAHDNWDLIENFCRMIGGRDDIWYATNIQIVDYMDAAKRLQYTAAGDLVHNPNAVSVWISVDDKKFEIPAGQTVKLFDRKPVIDL
ncbi:MAG: polysaccharide deacetylase family protein [Lachnospiraceae bacterium]